MQWSGSLPAASRRAFVALGLAALLSAGAAPKAQPAQDPAQQPPAQQQAPPPDALKFSADAAIVINLVKPEKAADFESVWATIRTKLSGLSSAPLETDKPGDADKRAAFKALNDTLKIFKMEVPGTPNPNGISYIFIADPASKAASYSPTAILYESGGAFTREEADALFAKLKDCYNQIVPWPLTKVG